VGAGVSDRGARGARPHRALPRAAGDALPRRPSAHRRRDGRCGHGRHVCAGPRRRSAGGRDRDGSRVGARDGFDPRGSRRDGGRGAACAHSWNCRKPDVDRRGGPCRPPDRAQAHREAGGRTQAAGVRRRRSAAGGRSRPVRPPKGDRAADLRHGPGPGGRRARDANRARDHRFHLLFARDAARPRQAAA
jgi:hypothetical protein